MPLVRSCQRSRKDKHQPHRGHSSNQPHLNVSTIASPSPRYQGSRDCSTIFYCPSIDYSGANNSVTYGYPRYYEHQDLMEELAMTLEGPMHDQWREIQNTLPSSSRKGTAQTAWDTFPGKAEVEVNRWMRNNNEHYGRESSTAGLIDTIRLPQRSRDTLFNLKSKLGKPRIQGVFVISTDNQNDMFSNLYQGSKFSTHCILRPDYRSDGTRNAKIEEMSKFSKSLDDNILGNMFTDMTLDTMIRDKSDNRYSYVVMTDQEKTSFGCMMEPLVDVTATEQEYNVSYTESENGSVYDHQPVKGHNFIDSPSF
ncbi:uncharacterized protein I206_101394 [Kwoniella pini CBS 10737]|uniref:Uncharacterized protein n=1 Tax=Kwoniella pini CBS 10737 TaxID=1296096 RepID=A0A1B9HWU4_9TREE|nr:uncharacterized protein I206_06636 [Kwoniella pini CBS 10737]OCF47730.1 hypothetical protein I206_06636 [Kwoniella pini CBS 10737]